MSKDDRKQIASRELPPEGLWVSPTKQFINVVEHLEAIRNRPEMFGLSKQDTDTNDLQKLGNIATTLIESGWIRYRQLDLSFLFEVASLTDASSIISGILEKGSTYPEHERVEVSQLAPPRLYAGSVREFRLNQLTVTAKDKLPNLVKWAFHVH
jgi:hypothetical protein